MNIKQAYSKIYEAALMGFVELQCSAMDQAERFADKGGVNRSAATVGTVAGLGTVAATAMAQSDKCGGQAASKLLDFISTLANFLITLGAGIALLMLAVGALFIIAGGTPERVSKGMKIIKNVVIGLAVLGAGMFIKVIVTTFIGGAQKGAGTNAPGCLKSSGSL